MEFLDSNVLSANIEITAEKWSAPEAVDHENNWVRLWIYDSPENSTKKPWRLPETSSA